MVLQMGEFRHCDDYIDDETQPQCLRGFLDHARAPAHGALRPVPHPELYADYKGGRVRVVMASRFGDVGITRNLSAEHGYQERVAVADLSNFSAQAWPAIGDQSPEGRDAKQARCDSTRAPVPNGQSPNPQPVSEADLDALVDGLLAPAYWWSGSGVGHEGENDKPFEAADAITSLRNQLTASEAREREMEVERKTIIQNRRVNDAIQTAFEQGELTISSEGWLTNAENHHHDR